jgi:hypothetical protein
MASNFDVNVVQGDTLKWAMYLQDSDGIAYNLGGCTLGMQVRRSYYPTSVVASYKVYIPVGSTFAEFPKGITGGISASATGGTIYISIGSTYTGQLSSEALAKYDIQLSDPIGSDTITILRGSLTVLPEVTRF